MQVEIIEVEKEKEVQLIPEDNLLVLQAYNNGEDLEPSYYAMIEEDGDLYPIVNEREDLNYKGMVGFFEADIQREGNFLIVIESPKDTNPGDIWIYDLIKDGQTYTSDLVDIVSYDKDFSFSQYLNLAGANRCMDKYAGVNFENYTKDDVERLINNGCLDSVHYGYTPNPSLSFDGGNRIRIKEEDAEWINNFLDECEEVCRYISKSII